MQRCAFNGALAGMRPLDSVFGLSLPFLATRSLPSPGCLWEKVCWSMNPGKEGGSGGVGGVEIKSRRWTVWSWENADDRQQELAPFLSLTCPCAGRTGWLPTHVLWGFAQANFTWQWLLYALPWSTGMALKASSGLLVELETVSFRTSGPAQHQARGMGCGFLRRPDKHFPWPLMLFSQKGAFTGHRRGCPGHSGSLSLTTGCFRAG